MRNLLLFIAGLALVYAAPAPAQTTVTVTVTPPTPQPFTVNANQPVTLNGIVYTVALTFTPQGATTPVTPPAPAAGTISRVVDSTGATVTTAPSGAIVVVIGAGLGSFGVVTVAGLPATVVSWTPTAVKLTLPTTGSAAGTATGPIALKPGDAPQVASSFTFTLTGLTTELPPVTGPSAESPIIAVSQWQNDPPSPTPSFADLYRDYIPAPEGPLPDLGPLVSAVRDASGLPVTGQFNLDAPVILEGGGFGETAGRLWINEHPAAVLSWADTAIKAQAAPAGMADVISVWVQVAAGSYYGSIDLRPEPAVAGEQ